MKRLIILILLCFLIPRESIGCDCNYSGPFFHIANKYDNFDSLYYKLNLSDKPPPVSMIVKILEVYKGIEKRKLIRFWGDFGADCNLMLQNLRLVKSG